eukprot:m.610806 g.610806  ORF g.610806 m.610806 type:complete len:391 (+) comp22495_c0_seq12:65-1237(+)
MSASSAGSAAGTAQDCGQAAVLNKILELEAGAVPMGATPAELAATFKRAAAKEMKQCDHELEGKSAEEALIVLKALHLEKLVELKRAERGETQGKLIANELTKTRAILDKANLARSTLEKLCRELQKQNKAVQEESRRAQEQELRKREALTKQFQTTIDDISTRISADEENKKKQAEEHATLRDKLGELLTQHQDRAEHFDKVLEAKNLEIKLVNAKLEHQTQLAEYEGKKYEALEGEYTQLKQSETQLKAQVIDYTEKFESLQQTLSQSTQVFTTYKAEMENMTKTISKLAKERNNWQERYRKVNGALIVAQDDKATLTKKSVTLENLCRALQAKLKSAASEGRKAERTSTGPATEPSAASCDSTCCEDSAIVGNGGSTRADGGDTETP